MILAAVVFGAMLVMDTAAAMKIAYLDQEKPWKAGIAELVNDQSGALSYGISGAALLKYGVSGTTVLILAALGAASVLGTWLGFQLSRRHGVQIGETK